MHFIIEITNSQMDASLYANYYEEIKRANY